ncbi:transmembrane protein 131 [Pectinophora gossypiella]|uniref:transmembrane protein 131 n=1 Tax=Pectinophora gossypiella TaxID=13191 RepID=UPI00214E0603|nr:transmembrane protein 131 [Pectinophora gossypiella]
MYRKIVWCYIIILTLLDISHNSKLTAQGKSHGVSSAGVHDHLVEGITIQEWGKDSGAAGSSEGPAEGASSAGAGAGPPGTALRLSPASLHLGPRPLATPHAAAITLTNLANNTLHLASVSGTTADFHASFFEAKSLAPAGNTSFSVVYLGRCEGLVSATLYIHTSLGVHRLQVSAEGVASDWGVWPLLALRVPSNASLSPLLTLRNPTPHPVQVSEVYSSGGWVRLALPAGAAAAPRAAWLLPPHGARPLVRLRVLPPPHHHVHTAYIKIKANITGGGLVLAVEARAAPPGEYAEPVQLRMRARGTRDPPDTFSISVGNSAGSALRLEAGVWGARCGPQPHDVTAYDHEHHTNGVKSEGAHVSLLRSHLEPHQELTRTAEFTLDYEKLWGGYVGQGGGGEGGGGGGAWCGGVLRLGRAAVPYSLRLLPGTLRLQPNDLQFVLSAGGGTRHVELRVHNGFGVGVRLRHVAAPRALRLAGWAPRTLPPGGSALLATVSLRDGAATATVDDKLVIHTNVTDYSIPLAVYDGRLQVEWEWAGWAGGPLRVGAVGASSTWHVAARLRNPAPRPLCARAAHATLAGADLVLPACAAHRPAPEDHPCRECIPVRVPQRCIPGGGWMAATLTLVAPATAGALSGAVHVRTQHGLTVSAVSATVHAGRLHAPPLRLAPAAPYAWAEAPLTVESTMALHMRVLGADQQPRTNHDPALQFVMSEEAPEIRPGNHTLGRVLYAPEVLCAPHCYTGLDVESAEGAAWAAAAGPEYAAPARRQERALLGARRAAQLRQAAPLLLRNRTLLLRTDQVAQIRVEVGVSLAWPRLLATAGPGWAGLAAVGAASALTLRLRNPSRSHSLLLQPVLGPPPDRPLPDVWEPESEICKQEECIYNREAFTMNGWRVVTGAAWEWNGSEGSPEGAAGGPGGQGGGGPSSLLALPLLRLAPASEIDVDITFAPREPATLTAYLYLRNNLTIVEGVQLVGRGAFPTFELGGRRPGSTTPLLFEVSECGANGVVRRTLAARNTGLVGVRLRDWRVAGRACAGRGFALEPCAALTLAPNQSAPLTLTFTPDFTLARVAATLELRSERARAAFRLAAVTAPRTLRDCAAHAPRPPFEPPLRAAGSLLALALLALVLAAAALDAERLLRRARAARLAAAPRAALDLRALHAPQAPPAPAPRAPRAVPRRRRARKHDPCAESRAFERWRAGLRRARRDDRSSDDAEPDPPPPRTSSSGESESESPPEPDYDERRPREPRAPPQPEDESTPEPADAEPEAEPSARASPLAAPSEAQARAARRRDADPRRERRADAEARAARAAGGKAAPRRDKPGRRRERAPPTPPRAEPPAPEARGAAPAAQGVRWGATWSSVVARSAAATPPQPAPPAARAARADPEPARSTPSDNSLFYFNGDQPVTRPEPEYGWRASPSDRPFGSPAREFLDEPVRSGGAYGSIGSASPAPVWAGPLEARAPGAAWPWPSYSAAPGSGAVRPPPGFGSSPATTVGSGCVGAVGNSVGAVGTSVGAVGTSVGAVGTSVGAVGSPVGAVGSVGAVGGARPFDPFHSLAAIWSRTALDWRADAADERQ